MPDDLFNFFSFNISPELIDIGQPTGGVPFADCVITSFRKRYVCVTMSVAS